jgi:hypothetical protein
MGRGDSSRQTRENGARIQLRWPVRRGYAFVRSKLIEIGAGR